METLDQHFALAEHQHLGFSSLIGEQNCSFYNSNNDNIGQLSHQLFDETKLDEISYESSNLVSISLESFNSACSSAGNILHGGDDLCSIPIDFDLLSDDSLLLSINNLLGHNVPNDVSLQSMPSPPEMHNNSLAATMTDSDLPMPSPFDCEDSLTETERSDEYSDTPPERVRGKRAARGSGMVNKKETNRAAAIRYRNKKLKQRDELFAQCEFYAQKNVEMKKWIDDTLVEISFIKTLLVEALVSINK